MRQYFEKMPATFGKKLSDSEIKSASENLQQIKDEEKKLAEAVATVKNAGIPAEVLKKRGEKTVHERIELLVDPGTFMPLNTLYNPENNEEGTTGVVNGIGKINGKYASIIASDNKVLAGAWIPGQAENIFRAQDIAERLHIPLVWVLNCSGVKLTQQEEVYAGRRGHGSGPQTHRRIRPRGGERDAGDGGPDRDADAGGHRPAVGDLGMDPGTRIGGAEITGVGHVHAAGGADEDGFLSRRLRNETVVQCRAATGACAVARHVHLRRRYALE